MHIMLASDTKLPIPSSRHAVISTTPQPSLLAGAQSCPEQQQQQHAVNPVCCSFITSGRKKQFWAPQKVETGRHQATQDDKNPPGPLEAAAAAGAPMRRPDLGILTPRGRCYTTSSASLLPIIWLDAFD